MERRLCVNSLQTFHGESKGSVNSCMAKNTVHWRPKNSSLLPRRLSLLSINQELPVLISVEALLHRCQLNLQGLLHKQLEFSLYFEWLQEFDRIFVYNHLFEIVTYQRISFKIVCQNLGLLHNSIWLLQLQLPTLLPSSWFKTPSWWCVGL